MATNTCGILNSTDLYTIISSLRNEKTLIESNIRDSDSVIRDLKKSGESSDAIERATTFSEGVKELHRERIVYIKDTEKKILECMR